jgi:hypothetical protein
MEEKIINWMQEIITKGRRNASEVFILFIFLVFSVCNYPTPYSYIERTPINITIPYYNLGSIKYSPDMSSLVYGCLDLMYRPSICANAQLLL